MTSVKEYVIAALLHDVGKLIRRAKLCAEGQAKRHVEHSLEFVDLIGEALRHAGVDVEKVKKLVEEHHSPTGGIAPYDKAAATERIALGDEESRAGLCDPERREQEIPMVIYAGELGERYLPPYPLSGSLKEAERLAPGEKPSADEVCEGYKRSYERLMKLAERVKSLRTDYERLVETLDYVLKSATAFVPAAVYGVKKADTSLYVHLKLTAALASTGGEFYLVAVDVGKIQEYLHKARTTDRAMAIMRGRSLRVSLAQKIALKELARRVNERLGAPVVTAVNYILDTGGEALMIVPKVDGLDQLAREITLRSLEDAHGHLKIHVAYAGPYKLDDVERWGELLEELYRRMGEEKLKYVPWSLKDATPTADTCDFCGFPISGRVQKHQVDDMWLCDVCFQDHNVGKAARNLVGVGLIPRRLEVELLKAAGCEVAGFNFLGWTALVYGGAHCNPKAVEGDYVYLANKPDDFIVGREKGYGYLFTNAHLPADENGAVKSLEELGALAFYVKYDANKMGERKKRESEKPTRLMSFSLAVSTAYELYANLLADVEKYRDQVFVVFAGGDDGFVVGSELALEYLGKVVSYAERWGFKTGVGVFIGDSHTPIYYAAHEAEARLDAAKSNRDRSMAVLALSPVRVELDAKNIAEVVKRVSYLAEPGAGEEARGDKSTFLFRFGVALIDLLKNLEALKRRGGQCQWSPDAERRIVKKIIELAYMWNRREEGVGEMLKEIIGEAPSPGALRQLFAPCLREKKCEYCEKAAEKIAQWAANIYLYHLLEKRLSEKQRST